MAPLWRHYTRGMATEREVETKRQRVLVQATIPPLDEDGILAFSVGSLVFAVLTVLAWTNLDTLRADGRGWWFHTALAGLAIGLLAVGYCIWRRRPRKA